MEKQVMRILSKLYRRDNRCRGENYRNYSEEILSEKEKEILFKCGWVTNDIVHFKNHGDTLEKLLSLKDNGNLSRERCVDAFVAGVGGSYLRGRSILAAWLLLDKIQPHEYYERPQFRCCWICGTGDKDSVIKTINNSYLQYCLHLGHLYYEPKYIYLNLKYFAEQPAILPTEHDIVIFRKLIELLRNAPDDERPSQCEKRLKSEKLLPSSITIRSVLQTLSLCGVLPNRFIELSENIWNDWGEVALCGKQIRAPIRSDLEMPWAGWKGSMKINEEKAERLFGRYINSL